LLATSLGEDAAREIVMREAKACGLEALSTRDEAVRLLKRIEKAGSTSGLSARLALSRIERGAPLTLGGASSIFATEPPLSAGKPAQLSELASMLAHALGDAKAEAVVTRAAQQLALSGSRVTHEEAVSLLENLSRQAGVVGTVARFAKVRFLLQSAK